MEGFLMRVAARDAPSRIDEARPYYPPNEDDETEEWQHATALPWIRRREAARGAGGTEPVAG
ncbi:hypothetical protein [Burkholderia metallica]|uniref:hypothetical protein n=1 Tax=Burkholderia metallica TaxID=488729 RepID=UPI001CF1FB42|nr:hypothetical protein [Burkholderia metallica]MCA8019790.1 hypothetical protein [Burkholderia metallica]